jgi:hypothetical protein
MPSREEWLNQGFLLSDHPFDPVQDPVHGLNLRAQRVSLSRPLDVFTTSGLEDYFAQVGSIGSAVTEVSEFLEGQGYGLDSGIPPVLLIEGPGGTGRKTLGSFVAHLMKSHCAAQPSFKLLRVTTDHFGRLLLEVRFALEEHFKRANQDTAPLKSRDAFIKPEDPDETVLAGLFSSVAQQNLGLPLLILLIDILEFRNFEWIHKLHNLLKDLSVALIFLTKDDLVTERFKKALGRGEYLGCAVCIAPLSMQDGTTLLAKRLATFRQLGAPNDLPPLTPYEMAAIQWIFTGGDKTRAIKILLNLCRVAMNRKLSDLARLNLGIPSRPWAAVASISQKDVREAYEKSLQNLGWGVEQ